jgi:hypothetical protein
MYGYIYIYEYYSLKMKGTLTQQHGMNLEAMRAHEVSRHKRTYTA